MERVELRRQMRVLMTMRLVTVTTLLVAAFAIELWIRPGQTLRPLFALTAVAYGLVLLFAVSEWRLGGTAAFLYLQVIGDAALVTGFVAITGGTASPMSFLYVLPIGVGSLLALRRGGLIAAGACWVQYAALAAMGVGPRDTGGATYSLVVHLVAFLGVAQLTAYLAERLRVQGTELAERQGAVARLQALNENIVTSIHSGLITTDLEGTVGFMNPGGSEITGLPPEAVEGRCVEAVLALERGSLGELRGRLIEKRRVRFERWFDTPAGSRIFLGIAVSNLYDRTGQPLGYIFIFQDLTEIHALEHEIRLKERMAALGEMAAGMAHELRNPLAAISGSVQYLKSALRPEGETLDLMDIILRESQRLDQAIRDFLTFARPGRFTPEPTDLVRLLEDSVRLLTKSREFRADHRVVTRFEAPSIRAVVDVNRMKQVFWNLATNALKAMPDGGTLTITAESAGHGRILAVTFEDDGLGMSEQVASGYFQPFRSGFSEGTGLGAAIVYRLVEEHGGRIRVRSAPGEGTAVRLELPGAGAAGTRTTPEAPSAVEAIA